MDNLQRYGVEWVGPREPIAVPMDDGYWTPWHIAAAQVAELKRVQVLYQELLYQVATVHPGETRHETAKRYIYNAERQPDRAEARSNEH